MHYASIAYGFDAIGTREWGLKRQKGERLSLANMQQAAAKFGGECLSTEYKTLYTPMRWRCAKGHEWEAQGQNVWRGKWCMRCSGKMRKTIEEMHTLAEARRGRCVSRRYQNMQTKLTWECEFVHRWKTTPHLVGQGAWCPRCGDASRGAKMIGNANAKRKKRD